MSAKVCDPLESTDDFVWRGGPAHFRYRGVTAVALIIPLLCSSPVSRASTTKTAASLDQVAANLEHRLNIATGLNASARAHRLLATEDSEDLRALLSLVRPPTFTISLPHLFFADDEDSSGRFDSSEAHHAQLSLALAASTTARQGPEYQRILDLVAAERLRPQYAEIVRRIEGNFQGHAVLVPPHSANAPTAATADTTETTAFLANHELSWFLEAVVLEFQARGWPSNRGWRDADGNSLSIDLLNAAHTKLMKKSMTSGLPFLSEREFHALSAVVRVAELRGGDAREGGKWNDARLAAVESLAEMMRTVTVKSSGVAEAQVAVHLLEVAYCPTNGDTLRLGSRPALRLATERVTGTVLQAIATFKNTPPQFDSHAFRALVFVLAARGQAPWVERARRLSCSVV